MAQNVIKQSVQAMLVKTQVNLLMEQSNVYVAKDLLVVVLNVYANQEQDYQVVHVKSAQMKAKPQTAMEIVIYVQMVLHLLPLITLSV